MRPPQSPATYRSSGPATQACPVRPLHSAGRQRADGPYAWQVLAIHDDLAPAGLGRIRHAFEVVHGFKCPLRQGRTEPTRVRLYLPFRSGA